jgi:hypothetical protein
MRASAILVTIVTLGACTSYDPQLGPTPFFCGNTDPKCPDGYTCMMNSNGSGVCTMGSPTGPGGHCTQGGGGQIALWDLTGQPGTQTSSPAANTLAGVTAQPLARSSALMPSPGTDSISSSNWPTSFQADPGSYYTLSLAAPSGCMLSISSVMLDVKSSSTGPVSAVLSTSEDGFMQQAPVSTASPGEVSISVTSMTGMIELRVFGFAAPASTGTMRIENQLTIMGTVQ